MIRQHTKTEDVPGVTDDQLMLYRSAAIEAAELYTGMLLSGQKNIIEPVQGPSQVRRPGHYHYIHRLRYPTADQYAYLFGSPWPTDNMTFMVPVGTRTIKIPVRTGYVDTHNCCDPCSEHHLNAGMQLSYRAGFTSPDQVPSGVIIGILQFIAWVVQHPGDELLTMRNTEQARTGGVGGTNNIAMASGALESWRLYNPEAV
jgi:hypothetical protein